MPRGETRSDAHRLFITGDIAPDVYVASGGHRGGQAMTQLIVGARLATLAAHGPYGLIDDGALAFEGERITYAGARAGAPAAERTIDVGGRLVTPGFIDPHTHLIYGGNRAQEWEQRLLGVDYAEIARRGGGILSTVRATRAAGDDALLRSAHARLARLCEHGVTSVEIKSGYGLDLRTELRMLRIARELGRQLPVDVRVTFLGAHTIAPEFCASPEAYVDMICDQMLPQIAAASLADAVDAFCETIAFSHAQTERIFTRATALGLPVKLHADQLSDGGGAELAARFRALSADHLEYTSEAGIAALARAGTVAVVLPGAYYFLREKQAPPIAALRAAGVPLAIATDCNPGTSPLVSPLLALNFACTLFGFTPEEALRAMTENAARALGLAHDRGTLEAGKLADLAIWDVDHPAELAYALGANPCYGVYKRGVAVELRDRELPAVPQA
jgi:imidazolonepropionase